MEAPKQRVLDVIEGRLPDRPPLYDLIRNDAVLSHFSGRTLTVENAPEVVPRAYEPMLDATRPCVRLPEREREEIGSDGRRIVRRRWTSWMEHRKYESVEAYMEAHCAKPDDSAGWTPADQDDLAAWVAAQKHLQEQVGEVFLFWSSVASPGLMGLFGEVGIEAFSYFLADCPTAIVDQLARNAARGTHKIEHVPQPDCPVAVFFGDDIAFKGGPICSPTWMRAEYFPRVKRLIDAWHKRCVKVLFHSDGNLMPILDDLVAAGIDGLNPIEVGAGMDIAEIHRRHPHLFLCGGIDVSQLLPFGTPEQVRDATIKAIEDAGGRLMVGSSTEIHDKVPLRNFLAMRDAALQYHY